MSSTKAFQRRAVATCVRLYSVQVVMLFVVEDDDDDGFGHRWLVGGVASSSSSSSSSSRSSTHGAHWAPGANSKVEGNMVVREVV